MGVGIDLGTRLLVLIVLAVVWGPCDFGLLHVRPVLVYAGGSQPSRLLWVREVLICCPKLCCQLWGRKKLRNFSVHGQAKAFFYLFYLVFGQHSMALIPVSELM